MVGNDRAHGGIVLHAISDLEGGGGVLEHHDNTMEAIWVGLRNFIRPFRGVHKKYLGQYVRVFEWAHNLNVVTEAYLSVLLGVFSPSAP